MTQEQPTKLTYKRMTELVAIDCQYHKYEVEDILKSFYKIVNQEIYKGNAVYFENLCKLQITKPKPKRQYNFKTKTVRLGAAHPRLTVTPTIGLLDFIREQEDTIFKVKKGTASQRHQHHQGKRKDYYDPIRIEREKALENLPTIE